MTKEERIHARRRLGFEKSKFAGELETLCPIFARLACKIAGELCKIPPDDSWKWPPIRENRPFSYGKCAARAASNQRIGPRWSSLESRNFIAASVREWT